MFNLNKILWLFLLAFTMVTLTNCGTGQSKKSVEDEKAKAEANQLLKEQNELYEKACHDLTAINEKVIELNDKIHSMKGKLTEDQNKSIDEIESKRASINTRMKGIKNVPQADWENFKTTLEKDIEDMKTLIDEVISGIK